MVFEEMKVETAAPGIRRERILILAKTYPAPSAKYEETVCVAGLNEAGQMRRLFPIQFRFLDGEQQFRKWQWIRVGLKKARRDHRPESHLIDPESLVCEELMEPGAGWAARRAWLDKIPSFSTLEEMEAARVARGTTLALLYPVLNPRLEITREPNPDWTPEEKVKLKRCLEQGDLFRKGVDKTPLLEKIPYAFHYVYTVRDSKDRESELRHKIIDWEAAQLFRRCRLNYGSGWEEYFREKLERDLGEKDLRLLMGTMHRFPDQWLIISLIYPPRRPPGAPEQLALNFGD